MEVSPIPSLLISLSLPYILLLLFFFLPPIHFLVKYLLIKFSRNEIGATNPATSKWIVENGRVYKKAKNAKDGAAMTPTEGIYKLMTDIHLAYGHKGRDNFFNLVKQHSGSIKKAFCHQFAQVCCEKAASWQGGSVPYGWQAPVEHKKAGNNAADDDGDEETDDSAIIDNINAAGNIQYPLNNMNAAANFQRPPTPQIMPDADGQFVSPDS